MFNTEALEDKINTKTKPHGSLGALEKLALQIGTIQQTLTPNLNKPTIVVFAGDHGIAKEGVSAYPQEVTYQMVLNFLQGGAAINIFAAQNNINLKIVDAGVNFDFGTRENLINAKIEKGTNSFLNAKALSKCSLEYCFMHAEKIVTDIFNDGCNVIGFGEMGIGNTSSATMLMSSICNLPITDCVGRGTGLNDTQLQNKIDLLNAAKNYHGSIENATDALITFGGFEIAQICGAILQAKKHHMLILVDGFIASAAFLVAYKINPAVLENAVFCHLSDEFGHKNLLNYLGVTPLLNLNMRLGEGTGCAVAYPIIKSAVAFLNDMASFESAGVNTISDC